MNTIIVGLVVHLALGQANIPAPDEVRKSLQIAPGLRVELAASEPQIESPVAIAFDERSRLWVVEMRDYPNGPGPGKMPEGRIRILEDRDGDGFFESSTIFADGLLFANGVLPWKDGALVTAAPSILHLREGGRRSVLYEGFAALNPQLRVSHPVLGIDGWVFVANGLRGGAVTGPSIKDPIPLGGMDFRFDPVHDRAEAISGMGQYGNTFDDWGNRFVCDNRNHLRHVVLPNRSIRRNPSLAIPSVLEDVSELPTGQAGAGAPIFPLSKNWTTSNLHAGRFTASCGVFIYRGSLLPETFRNAAFTCDPTGNLVHQEILRPNGATFQSRPAYDKKEFLASPNDWFRPVFMTHGPEGAIYLVDMARAVIEHPEFMPPELKKRPDLTLGRDKGRIWRIVPEKYATSGIKPLAKTKTADLVAMLESREPWERTTAQRLLLQTQDRTAVDPMRRLALGSKVPQARVQAAWLLNNFSALDEATLVRLLGDPHPRVREQAVVLAESTLASSAALQAACLLLAEDEDARVRFQTALSLGEWADDRILPALARVAVRGQDDRWTRYAVASAVPKRAGALLAHLIKDERTRAVLLQELATLVGSRRDPDEMSAVLNSLPNVDDGRRIAILLGVTDGLARRGVNLDDALPESALKLVHAMLIQAAAHAKDAERPVAKRLEAIRLLAHARDAAPHLLSLVEKDPDPEIKLKSVQALAGLSSPEMPSRLIALWPQMSPALRQEVVNTLLMRPERVGELLKAMENRTIAPRELDAGTLRRLSQYPDGKLRTKALELLAAHQPGDRKRALERYREALTHVGDSKKGREVFCKSCAACHRIADVGQIIGPDISDTRTRTVEQLLVDILDPNAAIDANFIAYQAITKSGKLYNGLISSETASSVTLRRPEGQMDVILRVDLDELRSTGKSLMPEGLENDITVVQMADLLSFLKNWRYLDGATPLGKP